VLNPKDGKPYGI